jgi:hypothetical protein
MRWIWVVAFLAACGDDAGTPSSENITGFWHHDDGMVRTIFAFVPGADVPSTVEKEPELTYPPGEALGLVYQATTYSMDLQQVTTFEVTDDAIVQTVIGDVSSPPGTMFSTKILAFDGETMTLESSKDPSGMRTYTRSERCPNENNLGWRVAGAVDWATDPNHHSPGIAIADDGSVYSLLAQEADTPTAYPRLQYMDKGCIPITEKVPLFGQGTVFLRDDEIHTVIEARDSSIKHRWKANRTAAWQEEMIAPPVSGQPPQNGSPLYSLHAFVENDSLIAIASRTNGVLEVFRRSGSGWQPVALTIVDPRRIEDAHAHADGTTVMLGLDRIYRLRGTTVDEIALPGHQGDNGINGGVRIAGDGKIHLVYAKSTVSYSGYVFGHRSAYAIWDGAAWTERDLGPMSYAHLATPAADGTLRVIAGERKQGNPPLHLYEIATDGSVTSEQLGWDGLHGGTSPPTHARFVVADGKDGTLAASFNAKFVYARHPERARPRVMRDLTIMITGEGRVYTDDGTIDCSKTCTVTLPEGSRHKLKMQPGPARTGTESTCLWLDAYEVDGFCWKSIVGDAVNNQDPIAVFRFD